MDCCENGATARDAGLPGDLEDLKAWCALSCPVKGLRFDARTLALLDADGDGRVRTDEVLAALAFLKAKGVAPGDLFGDHADDEKALAENLAKQADLAKIALTDSEKAALADWEAKGREASVAVCGEATAAAEAALSAVEPVVEVFFTPPDDLPLVTDEPDRTLPLKDHLNPKHQEAVFAFAEACAKPVLGARDALTRADWKAVKAAFAPFRAWRDAKPVAHAEALAALVEEERLLRYRIHLGEFLQNFVTMARLYDERESAVFQVGVLRIDGKELNLCFHVEDEAAHAALAGKSACCVVYLKLRRPGDVAERTVCTVVTAGTIGGLYVGRNGVFYDRDGGIWEATVTKVVESQVSLTEAFWAPWRKLGEGVAAAAKKFLGDRQAKSVARVQKGAESAQAGGAALASSVAAVGIGVGMAGAAAASVAAVVRGMGPWQLLASVLAVILVVSLPSVALTWFRLRRRDLGAILNASGWAVNRPIRFSMRRARGFTKCAKANDTWLYALLVALVLALAGWTAWGAMPRGGIGDAALPADGTRVRLVGGRDALRRVRGGIGDAALPMNAGRGASPMRPQEGLQSSQQKPGAAEPSAASVTTETEGKGK